MRLDHLLSREQAKSEDGASSKVDLRETSRKTRKARIRITVAFNTVSFSGFHGDPVGYIPAGLLYGGLAQLGERLPCKQEVSGSNPLISISHGWLAQLVRASA